MSPLEFPFGKPGVSGTRSKVRSTSVTRAASSVKTEASSPKSLPMQDTITLIYRRGSVTLLTRTIPFSLKGAKLMGKALEKAEEASRQDALPF